MSNTAKEDDALITMPLKVFHVGETGIVLQEEVNPEVRFAVPAHFAFLGQFNVQKDDRFTLKVVRR